jgi:regulator of cell morphogenesis and NO signaling
MEVRMLSAERPIGEYVAQDYRTASVFSKYKIDFCCNGHRTVSEACTKKGLDSQLLMDEVLLVLNSDSEETIDYNSWPQDLLIDYIEKKHHRYVEEKIPVLRQFLEKLCKVHGKIHPELLKIYELFIASAGELAAHMKKEELMLFPYIKRMVQAKLKNTSVESPQFGTIENPISMMMKEHDNEGQRFKQIAELTNNYNPPADGCTTFRVTYAMLEEFEKDLHLHIHLENNILFPKAIELQNSLH